MQLAGRKRLQVCHRLRGGLVRQVWFRAYFWCHLGWTCFNQGGFRAEMGVIGYRAGLKGSGSGLFEGLCTFGVGLVWGWLL